MLKRTCEGGVPPVVEYAAFSLACQMCDLTVVRSLPDG